MWFTASRSAELNAWLLDPDRTSQRGKSPCLSDLFFLLFDGNGNGCDDTDQGEAAGTIQLLNT